MEKRFLSLWFGHLATDWFSLRQPQLKSIPFVLRTSSHGRMIITAANTVAEQQGIRIGMSVADARAFVPDLEALDDKPDLAGRLLKRLAEWCIRFTPAVAIDLPDGLIMDVSGCTHLWSGDASYLNDVVSKLNARGYDVRASIADTIGAAWGVARFGKGSLLIESGRHIEAVMQLPPEALRLEQENVERLHKLGLREIRQFIRMPRTALRRRFGQVLIQQLDKAVGQEIETIDPVMPIEPYQERLPCLEPIVTATGIGIALQQLLEILCLRLQQEQKGLRAAAFKGYRVDGKIEQVDIATNRPSHHVRHLFKLFEVKLSTIEPALGIELFVLEAPNVEDHFSHQEKIWEGSGGLEDERLSELIDRFASRFGIAQVHRYVPDEHYWPERSLKLAASFQEKATTGFTDKPRPLQLLSVPERIDVTAPIPDYPPMLFRYNGQLHKVVKADGPERIEQEWWLQQGQHRDYYRVEDEEGHRYWLFRLGHYDDKTYQWFIHGFFA
ncbi:MAG TPA: DNA polymerase Y family protein [Chryseolinea sp.]|nr:DNA polymerase Y family protein [Chryseolinea sp.]